MKIVRKQLTTTEIQPAGTRWNAGTDTVQTTPDGGATWNNAPGLDPRHADNYRLPPLTGGSAQCDAAARMAAYVNVQVDNFLNAGSLAQAATGALGVLLLLFGGAGIIIDAILAAMDVLITIGATAISSAFNVTTYENLKCTFFCHIGADGQMTAAQLAAFQNDVFLHYSSTVYSTMVTIGSFTGEVQYSNAGVERSETGDCSACAGCGWCYHFDSTHQLGDWTAENYSGAVATWDGAQWIGGLTGDTNVIWISFPVPDLPTFTDASITESGGGAGRAIFLNGDGSTFSGVHVWQDGAVVGGSMPLANVTRIDVYHLTAHDSTVQTIQSLQFSGSDADNPFGTSNC